MLNDIYKMLVNSQKGWIPEASAKLRYFSLIMSLGLRNPFFFLGLLFNFSIMLLTYSLEMPLKSVFFGIVQKHGCVHRERYGDCPVSWPYAV